MARLYSDGASGTLLAPIDDLDTNIQLNAGQGENFPLPSGSDFSILTLEDALANIELVILDTRTGDNLTVIRGAEGTTPLNFPASTTRCELRVTASALEGFQQKVDDPITSEFYFEFPPVLANNISLLGEEVNLTRRNLVKMNTADQVEFGQVSNVGVFVGVSLQVVPAATFDSALNVDGVFTQGAASGIVASISVPNGLQYELQTVIDGWARGAVFTMGGAVQGGLGALGVTGGGVTRMAMGIGEFWYLEENALSVASPLDGVLGLQYAEGQVWHDGNSGEDKITGGNWNFSGVVSFSGGALNLFDAAASVDAFIFAGDPAEPIADDTGLFISSVGTDDFGRGAILALFGKNHPTNAGQTILGTVGAFAGSMNLYGSALNFNGVPFLQGIGAGSAVNSVVIDGQIGGGINYSVGVSSTTFVASGQQRVNFALPFASNNEYTANVNCAGSTMVDFFMTEFADGSKVATSILVIAKKSNTAQTSVNTRYLMTANGELA